MLWARTSPLTIRAYIKKYTGKKEADISMIDMLIFRNW